MSTAWGERALRLHQTWRLLGPCPLWIQLNLLCVCLAWTGGCYAPLKSPGIPACELPEEFRTPQRTGVPPLNLSSLTAPLHGDYILGPDDVLDVTVHELYPGSEMRPVRVQVMANGQVYLPMVGPVRVAGMNLLTANRVITSAYSNGFIKDPRTNVVLVEKSVTSVVVLGEVRNPGVYRLAKYENDLAHAIAEAGGLAEDAGDRIEIHRREPSEELRRLQLHEELGLLDSGSAVQLAQQSEQEPSTERPMRIVRIPLRGDLPEPLVPEDVILRADDVVLVPSRKNEVFYVVGPLARTNFVRFNIGARERDLGAGFMLPRDRDIDVVTAVAMAGYIDPIESPTTVTLQRNGPDGQPMLITVDLIKARFDRAENLFVQAGDIIYLNPDPWWWSRRTFDRLIARTLKEYLTIGAQRQFRGL